MATSREGIAYLDGPRLIRGFTAGIHRVISDQERLNRINVFPVPDGDTGTNLAITMQSVLAAMSRHQDRHAGRTLEVIADAALDGARGNSGAIIAQFLLGLGHHLRGDNQFADVRGRQPLFKIDQDPLNDADQAPGPGFFLGGALGQ